MNMWKRHAMVSTQKGDMVEVLQWREDVEEVEEVQRNTKEEQTTSLTGPNEAVRVAVVSFIIFR